MRIALHHGYELTGSGSNEYTRYLARHLAEQGHDVSLLCRETEPSAFEFVDRAVRHTLDREPQPMFARPPRGPGSVAVHVLPETDVLPVYVKDKQRPGNVKSFCELTDVELRAYHEAMVGAVTRALQQERPDVLHANHLVYQPVVAAEACAAVDVPFYVVPHGSAIEYTLREDERYRRLAARGLAAAQGVVWISNEVRQRVESMYPELIGGLACARIGIGVDTSLFRPLDGVVDERRASLERLKAMHVPGGKTAAQRAQLRAELARGDVEAVTRYRDAYDHKLADDDLPAILDAIPVDGDLVLFVGALTWGKGVQTLVAALPELLAERSAAHLVVVGSGTYREVLEGLVTALATRDEALFDTLVARGRELERGGGTGALADLQHHAADPARREQLFAPGPLLAQRVHFIGRLDHERLRCLFPVMRVAAFPSVIKEASPLVFAEALANGVLPSGAYHSGLKDGIDELRAELPAEVGGAMALPTAVEERVAGAAAQLGRLLRLSATPGLPAQLRAIAERRCDWRGRAAELAEFAESLAAAPRRAP